MYINNKSMYSLLKATTKPEQIVDFAKQNDIPAIGICDINSSQGFHSFSQIAQAKGVTAILAVDTLVMYKNIVEDVLLICSGNKSLNEINRALSNVNQNKPIDREELVETIVVFKNKSIETGNELDYIGIRRSDLIETIDLKQKILIDETMFARKNDFEFYKIIKSIDESKTLKSVHASNYSGAYLKLADNEMWYYDELYNNYLQVVNLIKPIEFTSDFKLPHFELEADNKEYLYKLMYAGLKRRLEGKIDSEYRNRLEHEYKVICDLDFVDYFLIVWDIIKYCRKSNIYVGPGRGSAAGSLLAYCLGITSVDPIKNGLLFERFLNPKRQTMPDIDLDFEDLKREQVVDYVMEKYGEDYACKIGTLSTYQAKSSFREVAKVVDINQTTINALSKKIVSDKTFKQNLETNDKLRNEFFADPKLNYILDYISMIEGMPKNKSIHAAGIIISDEPIYTYTSLTEGVSDVDSHTLERMGLVKFDILALSTLRHLHAIEDKIESMTGKKYNFNYLDISNKDVFYAISDGLTNFVFQLESKGMIATLKKFKPKSFDDLAAILALYRPGPMQFIDEYISRKDGKSQSTYIHDSLKPILESTHGIIVYQEQIMQIVQTMAGYDLGQADIFRRAISKKDHEVLSRELNQFVRSSIKRGYSKQIAIEAGKRIEAFANYGFNKSHAYSYAKISYALMYYKVLYPEVYYSYYLQFLKTVEDMAKFEQEISNLNLTIIHPSINMLCMEAQAIEGNLQLGLNNIKGLSKTFNNKLYEYVKENPNSTIVDIINNCIVPANLSKQELQNLICSGVFANYGYNERSLIEYVESKDELQDLSALAFLKTASNIKEVDNYSLIELEEYERKSINLNIRHNSYGIYFDKLKALYPRLSAIDEVNIHQLHLIFDTLVYVTNVKEIKTKTNKLMAFIDCKIEHREGSITVFPDTYQMLYDVLDNYQGYAIVQVKVISNGFSLMQFKQWGGK